MIEFRTIKKKYNEPGGLTKNFASECQNELSLRCQWILFGITLESFLKKL